MKIKVKKIKRCIIVLICMISVFCFSFSVSAIQSGEVTLLGTSGTLWNQYGNGAYYEATVINEDDLVRFDYDLGVVSGSPIAVYNYCTFSGYNYGTLKLTYWHYSDNGYGRIVFDSFNGLYDENGQKIASFDVYNDYEYVLEYTGYIPSNFSIRAYWQVSADRNLSNLVNFSFTPSYDNISNDINNNQDENTDKIINGGKDYNNVDGSAISDYSSADAQLNSSIEGSKNESVSFFNNFGSVLVNTPIQRGLLFVTATMKEFIAIDWLSNLLTFSLALGAFAFVLGATVMVVRASGNKERSEARHRQKEVRSNRRNK